MFVTEQLFVALFYISFVCFNKVLMLPVTDLMWKTVTVLYASSVSKYRNNTMCK